MIFEGARGAAICQSAYLNSYNAQSMYAGMQNAQQQGWLQETIEQQKAREQRETEYRERMAKATAEQKKAWADAAIKAADEQAASYRKYQRDMLMARICNKDTNMATRVERRRKYIREKWAIRGKIAAVTMISLPITIGGLALLWRFAVWAIFA